MGNSKFKNIIGYFSASLAGLLIGSWIILGLVHAGIVKGVTTTGTTKQSAGTTTSSNNTSTSQPSVEQTSTGGTITSVAKQVMPSVVGITSTIRSQGQTGTGVGSGIIIDTKGYILTNNHVASTDTSKITVSLMDGRNIKATCVWSDSSMDLSVIKIDADNLTAAKLGDSNALQPGDTAVAIGNPLGLTFQRTVTSGIISAVNRTISDSQIGTYYDLIQTDASINEGNSGGPLINGNGEVIGINSVKVTSAEGMGFAIPINITKPIIKSIEDTGKFTTPMIGISGIDKSSIDQTDTTTSNIKFDKGIYVAKISSGSPADKAGLKEGDVILSVNGKTTNTMLELRTELYSAGVGKTVTLSVQSSDGKQKDVKLTLVQMTQ